MPRSALTIRQQRIARELVRAHRTGRHKGAFSHVEMASLQWIQIVGSRIDATRGDCEALAAASIVSLRYGTRGEPTMLLREEAYEAVRTNFGVPRKVAVLAAIHELTLGDEENAVLASRVAELTGIALVDIVAEARRLEAEGRIDTAAPDEPEVAGDVYFSLAGTRGAGATVAVRPVVVPTPVVAPPAAAPAVRSTAPAPAPGRGVATAQTIRAPEPARPVAQAVAAPAVAAAPPVVRTTAPAPPAASASPAPGVRNWTSASVAPSVPPPAAVTAPVLAPPAQRTANAGMVHDVRAHFEDLAGQQVALTRAIDALLAHMAEGQEDPGELKRLVLELWLRSRSAVEFAGGVAELAQAFKLI